MKTLHLVRIMLLVLSMYLLPTIVNAQPRGNRHHYNQHDQYGRDDVYQHRKGGGNSHYKHYPRRNYGHRRFVAPPPPPFIRYNVRRHARASFCRHIPFIPHRMACRR